jgi:chromosome partitioning protein
MPVIAVVNRKGGSGKSTIATHVAAYCAHQDISVMLGDVDKQQSARLWLRLREQRRVPVKSIQGWTIGQNSILRAPTGVSHVVLDTPGGLSGLDLARVVMFADVILIPICNSVFDRESAAQCWDELKILPRISTGRSKVAVVGMRINTRGKDAEQLMQWASERELPYLGSIRDTVAYVKYCELGVTVFDAPKESVQRDLEQWMPITDWINAALQEPQSLVSPRAPASSVRVSHLHPTESASKPIEKEREPKRSGFFEGFRIPEFLRRK